MGRVVVGGGRCAIEGVGDGGRASRWGCRYGAAWCARAVGQRGLVVEVTTSRDAVQVASVVGVEGVGTGARAVVVFADAALCGYRLR